MKRILRLAAVLIVAAVLAGGAEAVVRSGSIRGKKGLSFGSVSYSFDSLSVTIMNKNPYNVNFGGSMLFLDKNYRVIARAELRTAGIRRKGFRRYRAFFTRGSGNEAQAAKYLEWEF